MRTEYGPLHGLRVVTLGGLGPAPFATMMLADMGADVVRIDRVGAARCDKTRDEARFRLLNRGSRSVAINLAHAEGAAVALELAAASDVVIEGFRPGVVERLGVGPSHVRERNPGVVYGRITGWGRSGPLAHAAGHDINYIARNGVLSTVGRAEQPPSIPLNILADLAGGGLMAVCGVLAALVERSRSGTGQTVDLAMVEGSNLLITMIHGMLASGTWKQTRGTNLLDSGAPFYDVYQTADGRWMAVGALEDEFFEIVCAKLQLPVPPDRHDPTSWPALRSHLAERFATRTQKEWESIFGESDACVSPVRTPGEWRGDDQANALGSVTRVDGLDHPRPPLRFDRSPQRPLAAPSRPGDETRQVLQEWLGLDAQDLLTRGIVAQWHEPDTAVTSTAAAGGR